MNTEDKNFSIEELSEEVKILLGEYGLLKSQSDKRVNFAPDPRTIRYYTTLGLISSSKTVNRQAKYKYEHVLQLSTIKALQGESFTLAEIQSQLYGKRNEELEAILRSISLKNQQQQQFIPMVWNEIVIEPGFKIMVDNLWDLERPIEDLIERFKMAISSLKKL